MFRAIFICVVWPIVRVLCFTAIGQGILLWLAEKEIFVSLYVARMIGFVEASAIAAPAWVGWMLAGTFGLLVSVLWTPAGRLLRKIKGSPNETHDFALANLDEWRNVDSLEIWRAGCLWKGFKPHYPIGFDDPAYASYIMLVNAAKIGQLTVTNPGTEVDAWSLVTRSELARFAYAKGATPEFLNDIIPNITEEPEYIDLHEAASIAFDKLREASGTKNSIVLGVMMRLDKMDQSKIPRQVCEILFSDTKIPLYGIYPPSKVLREIPREHAELFMFSDDASEFFDQYNPLERYHSVAVKKSDFEQRLKELT